MEGYFGPRNERVINQGDYEWELLNQPYFETRRIQRPTNIRFEPKPTVQEVSQYVEYNPEDESVKYVRVGLNLAILITEHILCQPFIVLRRQCQVNHNSGRYHILPVTLVPVVVHLQQQQSIGTLWKGIGSVLLVRGMALAVEDIISKITPWPKEISWKNDSLKTIGQHLLLKCVTLAIITPFYSASLVETVQSDIASEKPGIFDVFKEGFSRIISWSYPKKGRMLPVWSLVVPTVVYGIFKYICHSSVKNITSDILSVRQKQLLEKQGALPKEWSDQINEDIEVSSQMTSLIVSEVILYPFETVLHRLHLQGTRTIIDNLDSGLAVTPILTRYEDTLDCYRTTVAQEGPLGLYKGFGALILHMTVYTLLIKLAKLVHNQVSLLVQKPPPFSAPSTPNQPPQQFPLQQPYNFRDPRGDFQTRTTPTP